MCVVTRASGAKLNAMTKTHDLGCVPLKRVSIFTNCASGIGGPCANNARKVAV